MVQTLETTIFATESSGSKMYYIHKDHLGSYQTITDENGEVATLDGLKQVYSFDPWGKRRYANTWDYEDTPTTFLFDRGFTGHEHLPGCNLINMNGRVYDPYLGMFLSPDPYVQSPEFTQNFNRYGYCYNNPLIYTDPSGNEIRFDNLELKVFFEGLVTGMFNYTWTSITGKAPHIVSETGADVNSTMYQAGYAIGQYGPPFLVPELGVAASTGRFFYNGLSYGEWNYWDLAPLALYGIGYGLSNISWADKSGVLGPFPEEPHTYNQISLGQYLGRMVGFSGNGQSFISASSGLVSFDGWTKMSGGGYKATPGEKQLYIVDHTGRTIPSFRADIIRARSQANWEQAFSHEFTPNSTGDFRFGGHYSFGGKATQITARLTGVSDPNYYLNLQMAVDDVYYYNFSPNNYNINIVSSGSSFTWISWGNKPTNAPASTFVLSIMK